VPRTVSGTVPQTVCGTVSETVSETVCDTACSGRLRRRAPTRYLRWRGFVMRKISSLTAALLAAGISIGHAQTAAPAASKTATVYKQVGCGCCSIWAEQLRKLGFKVSTLEVTDLPRTKLAYGVPPSTHTCHTALIGGYVFEGHVPLDLVQKVLKERPKIAGLAVPGMPIGSPGMEMGSRKDAYDVLSFDRDGKTSIYAKR
jgi:hypothetical protein